jgi:hypothetical protein
MFPSLEDAVQSIPTSRPSPSPAPFYWGLPQIKRDELLWKRIKSDRESRKHGFVFGFSQSGWRAYSTKHSFRVGKSNPPYQFTYSDLLDKPKGRAKSGDVQFVVSPRPVDWEGRFRLAPLGTSRPTGDWIKTATVDSATVTTVFLPSLTEITFRTLASRAFAAQASALRNNSRRSGDRESASEGAKFWVQKPFDVADDLQKLPPGDVARREMAVGLGLNTFGVDLVLANLAPADRKYCRGLAMEVNGNVLMHLNLHQKRLVGILMKEYDGDARLAEEMYDKATLAFASSNYLVVRSVLTEAWMAFATRVEKAAADGIALLGEKVAAEALLQKYGFGNSWPVLELDDARLMGTFSRYLAGYARRERPDPKTSNPRTLETLSADQAEEWDTKEDYQQKLVALLQQLHRVFVDGIPEDKREKCRIAVIDAELQAESGWVEELAKADTIDPLNRVKIHTFITRLFN